MRSIFSEGVRATFLLAAHPDDEVIGAGCTLRKLPGLVIGHVTDGSPLDMTDARAHGFQTREQYARQRREELQEALRVAGAQEVPLVEFGIPDQQASLNLVALTHRLAAMLPSDCVLLTHPYEGGHPDHDACAFAAWAVGRQRTHVVRAEFTSYHLGPQGLHSGEFLGGGECELYELSEDQVLQKRAMFDCFKTQQETLQYFSIQAERFRPAPAYDFMAPPHPGQLFYEKYNWGMTGERFRTLAREAVTELGLGAAACG